MKRSLSATSALLGLLLPFAARADVTVDARYGLLGWGRGAGVEIATPAASNLSLRLAATDTDRDYNHSYSDVSYNLNYKLQTVGLLLDWRPTSGIFHLTGGLLYDNKQSLIGTAVGNVTINGTSYPNANVKAAVTWNDRVVPFFGLGWGNVGTGKKGLAWSADLGVGFVGNAGVKLTESTGTVSQSDLNAEQDNLQHDLRFMRRYPMASFGLGYTF